PAPPVGPAGLLEAVPELVLQPVGDPGGEEPWRDGEPFGEELHGLPGWGPSSGFDLADVADRVAGARQSGLGQSGTHSELAESGREVHRTSSVTSTSFINKDR